jgi:hypothetical protein
MICKSCKNKAEGKFCSNCGQKTNTHRLSFKHFVEHDLIHGVLHLDRGLIFTMKEIIINPTKVAVNYIQGKRKPYYNFFYLLLLISGVFLLFSSSIENLVGDPDQQLQTQLKNIKVYLFIYIPFYALASFLLLKKIEYNFIEHCIIAVVVTLAICCFNLFGIGLIALILYINPSWSLIISIIGILYSVVMIAYPIWIYYTIGKNHYPFWNLLLRIFGIIVIAQTLIAAIIKAMTLPKI